MSRARLFGVRYLQNAEHLRTIDPVGSDAEDEFVSALSSLDVSASSVARSDSGEDLCIDLDGHLLAVELMSYALIDVPRALQIVTSLQQDRRGRGAEDPLLVVAGDRIVKDAREVLKRAGVSWFDRRGHVLLRGSGLRIDAKVPGADDVERRPAGGRVKLATAIDLLLHAGTPFSVRETARRIGAAPSSVSEVSKSLRADGVLETSGRVDETGLFWLATGLWRPTWTPVERYPHPDNAMRNPALHLGFDQPSAVGWALSGDLAAAHLGAPMGLPAGAAPDLYLPTARTHRLAVSILGRGSGDSSAARLATPPVSAACEERIDVAAHLDEVWLVARPLFVALDLAQDPERGREVLEGWDPSPWGRRVW